MGFDALVLVTAFKWRFFFLAPSSFAIWGVVLADITRIHTYLYTPAPGLLRSHMLTLPRQSVAARCWKVASRRHSTDGAESRCRRNRANARCEAAPACHAPCRWEWRGGKKVGELKWASSMVKCRPPTEILHVCRPRLAGLRCQRGNLPSLFLFVIGKSQLVRTCMYV